MSDAIVVDHVSKRFKSYRMPRHTTIKDMVTRKRKAGVSPTHEYIDALKDVSFTVPEGTVLGVIGLNGSGKSALLKVLAGVYRPDIGAFFVRGRVSALLSLGMGFHPDLTGRENVMIGGLSLGLSRTDIRRAFDEIVQFAELEDFIDAPVRTYSSGMYARLAFSIAVHVDADVLLLDEVFAVGDAGFVEKSRARIDRFKQEGKTIVLVTHDMHTVETWCHQALRLEHGAVLGFGDPGALVRQYSEYIAAMLEDIHRKGLYL